MDCGASCSWPLGLQSPSSCGTCKWCTLYEIIRDSASGLPLFFFFFKKKKSAGESLRHLCDRLEVKVRHGLGNPPKITCHHPHSLQVWDFDQTRGRNSRADSVGKKLDRAAWQSLSAAFWSGSPMAHSQSQPTLSAGRNSLLERPWSSTSCEVLVSCSLPPVFSLEALQMDAWP